MSYPKDDQWTEYTVEKVHHYDSGGWEVGLDSGWCFFIPADSPVEPRVGMKLRQYGKGFGYCVRGCFLDGQCVFYRTEAEQDAKNKADLLERERQDREKFEANRAAIDARYDALPEIFRARIDKFRRNNPDFRWKYESYELFVCEEAVKIASLGSAVAISDFHGLPWEQQKKMVPGLGDGHSGNTFGAACRLAMDYLTAPENVELRHGALAPLVGSDEYGCVPRTTGASGQRTPRAKEQPEPAPTCTLCGKPMSVVRPGKYECYRERCQVENAKEQR